MLHHLGDVANRAGVHHCGEFGVDLVGQQATPRHDFSHRGNKHSIHAQLDTVIVVEHLDNGVEFIRVLDGTFATNVLIVHSDQLVDEVAQIFFEAVDRHIEFGIMKDAKLCQLSHQTVDTMAGGQEVAGQRLIERLHFFPTRGVGFGGFRDAAAAKHLGQKEVFRNVTPDDVCLEMVTTHDCILSFEQSITQYIRLIFSKCLKYLDLKRSLEMSTDENILEAYITTHYTEETQDDIFAAFSLFDFFGFDTAFTPLYDCLFDSTDKDPMSTSDEFLRLVCTNLDEVLSQHLVKLNDSATLHDRIQICRGLGHLQRLVDYTPIIGRLESLEPDEVQFALIVAHVTEYDETRVLELLESVETQTLRRLRDFIYEKENAVIEVDVSREQIVKQVRDFKNACGECLASHMLASGVLPGASFTTYMGLVDKKDIVKADLVETARNILSLVYLTTEGMNSALLVYRKYGFQLLEDLNLVAKVEVQVIALISKMLEYRKVNHETPGIPQASSQ